jgi:transposase, IS5 family
LARTSESASHEHVALRAGIHPEDGQKQQIDIAIPTFGYKNHISIDRRHGVIRKSPVTDAAAHAGARMPKG